MMTTDLQKWYINVAKQSEMRAVATSISSNHWCKEHGDSKVLLSAISITGFSWGQHASWNIPTPVTLSLHVILPLHGKRVDTGSKDRRHKRTRDAVHHHREKIHVTKARLESKVASTVKDQKGFLKYVNSKSRIRDNIGPLLDGVSHLTNRDIGKAEMFNAFYTSVFNTNDGPWGP